MSEDLKPRTDSDPDEPPKADDESEAGRLRRWDETHLWHPFTAHDRQADALMIVEGDGHYLIDIDGKNLERVTHGKTFDAFPVFSNDGKYLAFSSNRNNGGTRDTNLFIAEWQE